MQGGGYVQSYNNTLPIKGEKKYSITPDINSMVQ